MILERVDLNYTQSKFGKNRPREFEIKKKSNFANAKSPIQDWQFGKTSIAYTKLMPILYNRAILALEVLPNLPSLPLSQSSSVSSCVSSLLVRS